MRTIFTHILYQLKPDRAGIGCLGSGGYGKIGHMAWLGKALRQNRPLFISVVRHGPLGRP